MEGVSKNLKKSIEDNVNLFLEISKNKEINLISHFDTDGISSAAIMIQTLKKLDKTFTTTIVKSLDKEFIKKLPKEKLNLFLDLGSGNLDQIKESGIENVFIIDHHEIIHDIPENVKIVNSELHDKQKISASGLTYLFCKEIDENNKKFAKLAVLGMIGDSLEKEIDKLNNKILADGEIKRKRGVLIYPSTRPLNRTLEFCSQPYIPGVTGNPEGVREILREMQIDYSNGKCKSLIELDEKEMQKLVTAIAIRNHNIEEKKLIGDIFLIKLFNKLEDAREISAKINACSRMGESEVALQMCMEIPEIKKKAETIHARYKQELISALKFVKKTEKIKVKDCLIINAKNNIKDTIIGTVASILSNSSEYSPGTTIVTMAHRENNEIKISARNVGESQKNVREILNNTIEKTGGEVGGHHQAAGCTIQKEKEQEFIEVLKKNSEVELIKVNQNL
jgi:single-stranded-DNA-specific exonuclease